MNTTKMIMLKMWTRVFAITAGALTVAACEIHIGEGTGSGDSSDPSGGSRGAVGAGGTTMTPQQEGEAAFAALDPQELALASTKAGASTSYFAGALGSSNLDPATTDVETIAGLMEQYAPAAELAVNEWLASIDTSTLPLAVAPKFECQEDPFKCDFSTTCRNAPYANLAHRCYVTDCGSAKCSACPDWFPEGFKTPILKSWCAYVCVEQNVVNPKVVAIGAGGVSAIGKFVQPYCFAP
jgi:hypothetical protein